MSFGWFVCPVSVMISLKGQRGYTSNAPIGALVYHFAMQALFVAKVLDGTYFLAEPLHLSSLDVAVTLSSLTLAARSTRDSRLLDYYTEFGGV